MSGEPLRLLPCPACGRSVSSMAPSCPGCGHPMQVQPAPSVSGVQRSAPPPSVRVAAKSDDGLQGVSLPRRILLGSAALALALVVVAWIASSRAEVQRQQAQQDAEAQRRAEDDAKTVARVKQQVEERERSILAQKKAREDALAAATQRAVAMTPAERAKAVRACAESPTCDEDKAILAGAPKGELPSLNRIRDAMQASRGAAAATDGARISEAAVAAALGPVTSYGTALLDQIPTTTAADAKKDPDEARGKALRVSGHVVEIAKTSDGFEGALALGDLTIVRFITPLATTGIYADGWGSFRGIFIQEYAYPNVSGGQTRSLLLVGGFELPENRDGNAGPIAAPSPRASPSPLTTATAIGAAPRVDCDPPYTIDATGRKQYKSECLAK